MTGKSTDHIKLKPQEFEQKVQKLWADNRVYQPDIHNAKKPFYNLMMFPYPSAEGLHVGNMYAFTGVDIYGRFKRMQGYDVLEPIGLDGFGIHSENYAIKVGRNPADQAKLSEKNFYRQLASIGNGFAWDNRLETYDPEYYKWTQWIFVKMYEAGLAVRKKSLVNFCPFDKTVLSDEQVIDGKCERCKNEVEKREMEQWFFKITAYAEKLLQNTYRDDFNWSEKVKVGQRNWIGKKTGISIKYRVTRNENTEDRIQNSEIDYEIECFTTRPDTNFGATFVVIAPEHEFVKKLLNSEYRIQNTELEKIKKYVETTKKKSDTDRIAEGRKKTGVFTGFYAVNGLNDYKMPIWISDFVLSNFGTGAVVGVPAHDLRDFQFAKEFNIPIKRVVVGKDGDKSDITEESQVQEEEGKMINSEFLDGLDIHTATEKMMDHLEEKGFGKRVTTYRLRDWCVSRQRYWGAPIPMVYCETCAKKGIGWHTNKKNTEDRSQNTDKKNLNSEKDSMPGWYPVPEKDLPVLLPPLTDWKPEGTGKGPLAKIKDFVATKCPKCGGEASRETDVCDTFLDSAWYFLRYPSIETQNQSSKLKNEEPTTNNLQPTTFAWDPDITRKWLPVTSYIGGAEHTVLHLLYSRFTTMVLKDLGYLDFEEPYKRFFAHGLIIKEGAKMSKSRGNVVVPDEYITKYGADTLRTYLMFLGPFEMGGDFRDTGIAGMYKFLSRVYRLVIDKMEQFDNVTNTQPTTNNLQLTTSLNRLMHKTIRDVTTEIDNLRYNTAIAKIMEYVNSLTINHQPITINHIETLLLLLAPFAPHMTEELWQKYFVSSSKNQVSSIKNKDKKILNTDYLILDTDFHSIHTHPWPSFDPKMLEEGAVTIAVQINGKLRDTMTLSTEISQDQAKVESEAKSREKIVKYLENTSIRKVIYVPGKILNFVI